MRNFKSRLKRIEDKTGANKEKSYTFINIMYPEGMFRDSERKGEIYFNEDNKKCLVLIHEKNGDQTTMGIDSASEEGEKILLEHGYKIHNERRQL